VKIFFQFLPDVARKGGAFAVRADGYLQIAAINDRRNVKSYNPGIAGGGQR